jgi:hypothetical protein
MTIEINRRAFLQSLVLAGASYVLPAKATKAQVDKIWSDAQLNPWYFEVDDYGTLVDADINEPQVWADVFDITTSGNNKIKNLISEIEGCPPLSSYLNRALEDEIESLEEDLEHEESENSKEQKALLKKIGKLREFRDEYDEPWVDWIELEGENGISKFNKLIDEWLSEPVDWMQSEFFPARSGPQGAALGFFQDQPYEVLDALGVVVVEGEHPGSTYYAAELKSDIDDANNAAIAAGIPVRFKKGKG